MEGTGLLRSVEAVEAGQGGDERLGWGWGSGRLDRRSVEHGAEIETLEVVAGGGDALFALETHDADG